MVSAALFRSGNRIAVSDPDAVYAAPAIVPVPETDCGLGIGTSHHSDLRGDSRAAGRVGGGAHPSREGMATWRLGACCDRATIDGSSRAPCGAGELFSGLRS